MQFRAKRDSVTTAVGITMAMANPVLLIPAAVGAAAKKLLIREDDSKMKKILIGAAVTLVTGGTGLVTYALAHPGREPKGDVKNAQQAAAEQRYQS